MIEPFVGTAPEYELDENEVPWVLGTQLHMAAGPLARATPGDRVLMIEAHEFARRKPYHHHKLTLVFAAMRQFRDRLSEAGYDVEYVQAETFGDGLERWFSSHPKTTLVLMRSPSYGSSERFRELVEDAGGSIRIVESELFCSTRAAFDEWAAEQRGDRFRHEQFYRWMRRESGILLTDEDEPVGGEWNYDEDNRETPPEDWTAPLVPSYEYDALTERTADWVTEEFETWGSIEDFCWPVTRAQAETQLSHFVETRLPEFGPYQDAMRSEDWAMTHALLSPAINLGLLSPQEVVRRIEAAYEDDSSLPLNSVEGVIRQVLGWREFMRHIYRHRMPELATANQLGADHDLPDLYWTGETDMQCLRQTVADVYERGYSHHIQRLMVLANFATLWGVEPTELNEWFHATYVDAYHWVTTPNVVEMGQYADGAFATKPYVSSANYIDRMSDYCADCQYYETKTTGDRACPFNALYWDFLARNEERLRSNHRMGLMYSHVDDKRKQGRIEEIHRRVDELRAMEGDDEL
jgi:deoxyribodipyrimidine photolyase-related protein